MNNLLNYDFVVKITALIFPTWNINLLTVPTFNIFEYMTSILTSSLVVVILLIKFYCYLVTRWLIRVSNEDKMRIHRLYEQGFGAKAIRASYPVKHSLASTPPGMPGTHPFNILVGGDVNGNIPANIITYFWI